MCASKRTTDKHLLTLKKTVPTDMEPPLEEFSTSIVSGESNTDAARQRTIAEGAYFRAQQRGFEPGHDVDDWLAAEAEITGCSLQRSPVTSTVQSGLAQVGAMDPELKNSPVAQEFDEDSDTIRQLVPGEPVCYFNGQGFAHDAYVGSGMQVLRCRYGVWIDAGPADRGSP